MAWRAEGRVGRALRWVWITEGQVGEALGRIARAGKGTEDKEKDKKGRRKGTERKRKGSKLRNVSTK